MNQYEIEVMASNIHACPNVRKGVKLLYALMEAVNAQSDGWAYWRAPSKAAIPLMNLLCSAGNIRNDTYNTISNTDLRKAITPIKRMVTHQKKIQARRGNKFDFDVEAALGEKPEKPKVSDGVACVLVDYQAGVLTVKHGETGAVLFTRPSTGEEWTKRIFPTLRYPPTT